jgi:hypothetical protein
MRVARSGVTLTFDVDLIRETVRGSFSWQVSATTAHGSRIPMKHGCIFDPEYVRLFSANKSLSPEDHRRNPAPPVSGAPARMAA